MIVVHGGAVVFKSYPGMLPGDRHIWFSVSKVLVSTAIAILEDRGLADPAAPVDFHFHKLGATAWEGVRGIDVLDMCSGIDCPISKNAELMSAYGFPTSDAAFDDMLDFLAGLPQGRAPGELFEYSNANTILLTLLVEELSGCSFVDFLAREIWTPMGAEHDGLMLNGARGHAPRYDLDPTRSRPVRCAVHPLGACGDHP